MTPDAGIVSNPEIARKLELSREVNSLRARIFCDPVNVANADLELSDGATMYYEGDGRENPKLWAMSLVFKDGGQKVKIGFGFRFDEISGETGPFAERVLALGSASDKKITGDVPVVLRSPMPDVVSKANAALDRLLTPPLSNTCSSNEIPVFFGSKAREIMQKAAAQAPLLVGINELRLRIGILIPGVYFERAEINLINGECLQIQQDAEENPGFWWASISKEGKHTAIGINFGLMPEGAGNIIEPIASYETTDGVTYAEGVRAIRLITRYFNQISQITASV